MAVRRARIPKCIVIGGPNGAGKTTFAREFLPRARGVVNFVNADLIAAGLSPLRPALAARAAGRLVLAELDRLATTRQDFAFEVPRIDVLRRFKRGLENFTTLYQPLADSWELYDNSGPVPVLLEKVR